MAGTLILFTVLNSLIYSYGYGPISKNPVSISPPISDNSVLTFEKSPVPDYGYNKPIAVVTQTSQEKDYWWLKKQSPFVAISPCANGPCQPNVVVNSPSASPPVEVTQIKYETNPFIDSFLKGSPCGYTCATKIACDEAGYICAPENLCRNGYISKHQLSQLAGHNECILGKEACCKINYSCEGSECYQQNPSYTQTVAVVPPSYSQSSISPGASSYSPDIVPVPSNSIAPTQTPYNGPQNTTPYPGCAAALKCVPDNYCTIEGVMTDIPVVLTKELLQSRVPLSECLDVATGIIGKCCRDPNYKDPWPDHDHGHDHHHEHTDQSAISTESPQAHYTIKKPIGGFQTRPSSFPPALPSSTERIIPIKNYTPVTEVPVPAYSSGSSIQSTYQSGNIYSPSSPPQAYIPPAQPAIYVPVQPVPAYVQPSPPPQPVPAYVPPSPPQPVPAYVPPPPPKPVPAYVPPSPQPVPAYVPPSPQPVPAYVPPSPQPIPSYVPPSSQSVPVYISSSPKPVSNYVPPSPPQSVPTYVPPSSPQPIPSYSPSSIPPYVPPQPTYEPQSVQTGYYKPPSYGLSRQPLEPPLPSEPYEKSTPAQIPSITVSGVPVPKTAYPQCGIRAADGTEYGETPWHAVIYSSRNKELSCGGAIVSENAILTSAHCLEKADSDSLYVKVGPESKVHKIATVVRHPNYDAASLSRDLALAILKEPIQLDAYTQKICLPSLQAQSQSYNKECYISTLSDYFNPDTVQRFKIQTFPYQDCEIKLRNTYLGKYFVLNDSFTCASTPSEVELCRVKSGEPVACDRGDGVFELYGIKSWDLGCTEYKKSAIFSNNDVLWVENTLVAPLEKLITIEQIYQKEKFKGDTLEGVNIQEKPGFALGYGK